MNTLAPSDQDIDPAMSGLTQRRRVWTLTVACLGVLAGSMLALAIVVLIAAALITARPGWPAVRLPAALHRGLNPRLLACVS